MIDFEKRRDAFIRFGLWLRRPEVVRFSETSPDRHVSGFMESLSRASQVNPWFIPSFIHHSIAAIAEMLEEEQLDRWLRPYAGELDTEKLPQTVGLVMAGNIPLAGFHDFISVLVSGNSVIGKLSHDDRFLLPGLARVLTEIEPGFLPMIRFTEDTISGFDAVIATGSDNTARYFDYYFGKYPHIIRRNRNGAAVITGRENRADWEGLADDIFLYFGLGCRSVSSLFVPVGFDPAVLFDFTGKYRFVADHHKYMNNYEYYKAVYLINGDTHLDNGYLMLKQDDALASPVSVVHYFFYDSMGDVKEWIRSERNRLQCVICSEEIMAGTSAPGSAQRPRLWDWADDVDTLKFLINLRDGQSGTAARNPV
ncbi:MAG: aldehyde dehydrogenase [Bacteroidales bacterium]|nr:aldehyde dehydrogenase [Bacteroidales bacterium]